MALWENTVYLACTAGERLVQALAAAFATEGMQPVPPPAPRERQTVEPMQYAGALDNDLWAVAVFPGASGWSLIKTAPLDLLVERAAQAPRMRLAALCARLDCVALHFASYDGDIMLTEVARDGDVLLSGIHTPGSDPLVRHGEVVAEANYRPGLRRLRLLSPVDFTAGPERASAALGAQLGGANAAARDNLVCVQSLIEHRPLPMPGAQALYFRWTGPSRERFTASTSWAQYAAQHSG
jgi:hypothetical protein